MVDWNFGGFSTKEGEFHVPQKPSMVNIEQSLVQFEKSEKTLQHAVTHLTSCKLALDIAGKSNGQTIFILFFWNHSPTPRGHLTTLIAKIMDSKIT